MTWAVIPMPSLLGTLVFERTAGETFRAPGRVEILELGR